MRVMLPSRGGPGKGRAIDFGVPSPYPDCRERLVLAGVRCRTAFGASPPSVVVLCVVCCSSDYNGERTVLVQW